MSASSEFLHKAFKKFGDRFDYSKVVYDGAKVPVEIVCPDHGPFTQTPANHLRATHGCPSCFDRAVPRKTTHKKPNTTPEDYVARLNLPNGYSVDMSEYVGITAGRVGIVCPIHGVSWEPPRSALIRSYPCAKCGAAKAHPRVKSYDDFLSEAHKLYGDKYSYSPSEYTTRKSVLTITCSSHGPFVKVAQKHLSGQGCPVCTFIKNLLDGKYPGGYSERFFLDHPESVSLPATLYYARVGRRYKIGITAGPVARRLSSIRSASKQETVLVQSWGMPLRDAYREEQRILAFHASRRIARRWSTEVFDGDVLRLDTDA